MTSRFGRGALSQFALHIVEIGLDRLAAADVLNDDESADRFHVSDDVFGNDADAAFVAANTGRLEGSAVQAEFVRHSRESNRESMGRIEARLNEHTMTWIKATPLDARRTPVYSKAHTAVRQ